MMTELEKIEHYYRWHAPVYDLTRWTFLFGRKRLIENVLHQYHPETILEIGCGTGSNLRRIGKTAPNINLFGIDASAAMLNRCRKKLEQAATGATLRCQRYDETLAPEPKPDVILFSYSLSMINPGWKNVLDLAFRDLRPGGLIAVVDFHDAPAEWFRNWMNINLVTMEGHLLPALRERFQPLTEEIKPAFGGMWRYLLFLGRKR